MQGLQKFQADSMVCFNLENFIEKGHVLRKIERQIDFSFIRQLTARYYCENNGRPSIDPEVFFRIVLIGYLFGIQSDRQLCEEIHYNLAYRWFCHLSLHDKVPEHSSLTKIRDRFGLEGFKEFFDEIVKQCKIKNLVTGKRVMNDSTLIAANASLDSMIAIDDKTAKRSESHFPSSRGLNPPKSDKISNKTHRSQTDPDATLAYKNGTPRNLKYKNHVMIDADSRVILDTHITTGACHDSQVYIRQLDKVSEEHQLPIEEAIADRAYGSGEIIQGVLDKKIDPIIPLFSSRSGTSSIPKGFLYDKEKDRYQCIAGNYLVPYPAVTNKTITYHSDAKKCVDCSLKPFCEAIHQNSNNRRLVKRYIYEELFAQVKEKMKQPYFQKSLAERLWKMEGIISEGKTHHCLSRAKYRGINKMQIQAYLSASVQNMKRIIIYLCFFIQSKYPFVKKFLSGKNCCKLNNLISLTIL